ncbi:hypothetical protein [Sphingomonas bacterium]|uniref:hypothetical protein n=1 Tax=Sphingomonas bacterium TaxID=1895847 RepID=UPI0015771DE5|nr:hypothetical protein [Sphingomonas bacterium]
MIAMDVEQREAVALLGNRDVAADQLLRQLGNMPRPRLGQPLPVPIGPDSTASSGFRDRSMSPLAVTRLAPLACMSPEIVIAGRDGCSVSAPTSRWCWSHQLGGQ